MKATVFLSIQHHPSWKVENDARGAVGDQPILCWAGEPAKGRHLGEDLGADHPTTASHTGLVGADRDADHLATLSPPHGHHRP